MGVGSKSRPKRKSLLGQGPAWTVERQIPPRSSVLGHAPVLSRLAAREKQRVVTKRVAFGELFQSAEFPPTYGLTPNAESFRSRRFVFSACHATTCDKSPHRENSLAFRASAAHSAYGRFSSPNSRALCLTGPFWLTDWFSSDPGSNHLRNRSHSRRRPPIETAACAHRR